MDDQDEATPHEASGQPNVAAVAVLSDNSPSDPASERWQVQAPSDLNFGFEESICTKLFGSVHHYSFKVPNRDHHLASWTVQVLWTDGFSTPEAHPERPRVGQVRGGHTCCHWHTGSGVQSVLLSGATKTPRGSIEGL